MLKFLFALPVRLFAAILEFPSRRDIVKNSVIPHMVGYLRDDLVRKDFAQVDLITEPVALVIIQEALRRSAENEKDGQPRYGEFCKQIQATADSIIATFAGRRTLTHGSKASLLSTR